MRSETAVRQASDVRGVRLVACARDDPRNALRRLRSGGSL